MRSDRDSDADDDQKELAGSHHLYCGVSVFKSSFSSVAGIACLYIYSFLLTVYKNVFSNVIIKYSIYII